ARPAREERGRGADRPERLAVDQAEDVARPEAAAFRRPPWQHVGDERLAVNRPRPGATARVGKALAQEETELGRDPLAGDLARHRLEPDQDLPPPVAAEDGQR